MNVSEFAMWELQENRESKCISVSCVAGPLKRHSTDWGALWGRHWGFLQLPVFRQKASSAHNAGRRHLPLSAHTFLKASSQQPAASSPVVAEYRMEELLLWKKKMLFIRFYETNEAGPCGVGGGQCIPPDWWNLLTLHYNWAGFLLLGLSHPSDTPQRFHGLQVTNVWSEQWIARRSLSLRVWCLREDILVPGKGLTYQGLSLRLGRMCPCEEIGRWKVNSVYDISSEDWDPPQGTNIHISTWMGKTTANPSINCLTCTYHVISIAPC